MGNLRVSLLIMMVTTLLLICNHAAACTDFRVIAKDGTVVITRSLEFAMDLKSNLRSSPRARLFNTIAPDGKPGISWKSKYGYLYLDGLNVDAAMDGMNEEGLSFEALYLPNEAGYQTVPAEHDKQALPYLSVGDWILSNFKTVDEVRKALPAVTVFAQKMSGLGDMVFPLHFAVYDATGKGIVIEYVGGKLTVYDNIVGVMTNSPTYDWHVVNLHNYIHLVPVNPSPVVVNGMVFAATGQGFGMIGLPGDISPPSRFVKTAVLLRVAVPVNDAAAAVNLGEHVINNVDILRGLAREPENGGYTSEDTQWVVFKDLTHKIFYYRTYDNMTLRAVSLAKVNFAENAPHLKMPLETGSYVQDVTQQFVNQK